MDRRELLDDVPCVGGAGDADNRGLLAASADMPAGTGGEKLPAELAEQGTHASSWIPRRSDDRLSRANRSAHDLAVCSRR
jgi:hypothetical protein